MTKLKTLKDFPVALFCGKRVGKKDSTKLEDYKSSMVVDSEELRQEAIKWVKELSFDEACRTDDEGVLTERSINQKINYFEDVEGSFLGIIKWLQFFFNLTDEDLK